MAYLMWSILSIVLRAAIWRATPDPQIATLRTLYFWGAIWAGYLVVREYFTAGSGLTFHLYGINAWAAYVLLCMVVAAVFIPSAQRVSALAALAALLLIDAIATDILALINITSLAGVLTYVAFNLVWLIGASFAVLRTFAPARSLRRNFASGFGVALALMLLTNAFPHDPFLRGEKFERRTANIWEYGPLLLAGYGQSDDAIEPQRDWRAPIEIEQAALMDKAISNLKPQRAGVTDVYAIGMAGWSSQDVFIKESENGLAAIERVLPTEGRSLLLANHFDRAFANPMASRQNLAAAVRAVAKSMDKEEDILLLFVTSHGSQSGAALYYEGVFSATLAPDGIAEILNKEGVRNRIVIVSACYAGVFVKPLASDDSIVMTASDDQSTSFGCSNEREWTYFGDALMNQSLKPGKSLSGAFDDAKTLIDSWERRDGMTPSNPQAHFGTEITRRLSLLPAMQADQERPPSTIINSGG